ncbi:M-phase phosphoprotein, putative [Perkinsus marinus ATCC 50983]|uniref:M-phase phosphoprotein, putative n=1 Tax=Perkinsus marinus (strain ATCC 50983 / TXsc) TaxID=423536 RepID=C5LK22_PERM5|nr:M-phase phosphoprotein, putative [Perkinsus marinus ATCC 50983]EER02911.1 M-phase phosphoprotein, putative [Perkinsus marinus ATCC 50983]|eukprot:XP_002771095.1 M-phase phosphoprotein, putative [Perkinsus marinus ATCC 50983]
MSRGAELTAKQKLEQEQRAIRKRLEWSVPGFKDCKSADVAVRQPGQPLKQVVLHGRRSYGGFNPHVESMMGEVTKRSSKLKRKRIE